MSASLSFPPSRPSPLDLADLVLAPTYRRPDVLFSAGDNATLYDADGRAFLDFTSGIGVNALGHGSPIITRALQEAATGLVHVSNLFHTTPPIELARLLCELSFGDCVFFCNSGAEAVEGAIKVARLNGGEGRRTIVSFSGGFHGRTFGALAATDRPDYQRPFTPLPAGFRILPWEDAAALPAIDDSVAGVLVEPIQGEGGVRVADPAWLRALRARCDETGALLIFDEIQCGLGRTGQLWAHTLSGVVPDLMTLAKPLAGGLPIGAVIMTRAVASALYPGCHATTFGGGPLVTAVARAVVETIARPEFLEAVAVKGAHLRRRVAALDSSLVRDIRGAGVMVGLELTAPVAEVAAAALDAGLLVVPAANNTLRLLPPLTVSLGVLDDAVARLGRVISECAARSGSSHE